MTPSQLKVGFILIPGFSLDNQNVAGLKIALEASGYHAEVVNFFGNAKRSELPSLKFQDCLENISAKITELRQKYERVIGIGVSLGGAALLEYAKTKNDLDGIVSVGTPFRLRNRFALNFIKAIFPAVYFFWRIFEKKPGSRMSPIGAGPEVVNYLNTKFLEGLERINTPSLFLHSKKDMVADYRAVQKYSSLLAAARKEVIFLENGSHIVDHDPASVINKAVKFLEI